MFKRKKEEKKTTPFLNKEIDMTKIKPDVTYDFSDLYKQANDELSLQQSKRDQIITLYLAIFSFLIPFALSAEGLNWVVKGLVFHATALIGILFAVIIIRYRIYKEAYWLACQSITVLMNFDHKKIDKNTVQSVYYQSLYKKGHTYVIEHKDGTKEFDKKKYRSKNLNSAETLHFAIQVLIASVTYGLSWGLISTLIPGLPIWAEAVFGVLMGVLCAFLLMRKYFNSCMGMYAVLVDDTDESFNGIFSKAWFMHFYV